MPFAASTLLSIDSLIASIALAPRIPTLRRRVAFMVLFGVFDSLAFFAGAVTSLPLAGTWPELLGPGGVIAYALYIALVVDRPWDRVPRGALYVVPVLLSLDNLAYGGGNARAIVPTAIALGLSSAVFSYVGFLAGRIAERRLPWSAPRLTAVGLALTAVAMVVF